MERRPHKFDPANAGRLDSPERGEFLPSGRVLDLLSLRGNETVVDYGAGSGVLTVPLGERLMGGTVHAVDESPRMLDLLRERLDGTGLANVRVHRIAENAVPLNDDAANRILAVNLLHEVIGEGALAEMRRLLAPDGLLLVVDWRGDVEREPGPPLEVSLSTEEGRRMLEEAGFEVEDRTGESGFPYHFALLARPEKRSQC